MHTSNIPFQVAPLETVVVYCSDGRFGDQTEEFLNRNLGLKRYDRLVVPGGAACLTGYHPSHMQDEGIFAQLRFLIEAHALKRVVLIAHDDCGYYKLRLGVTPKQQDQPKRDDLVKAAENIRNINPQCEVQTYIARLNNNEVYFDEVRL